MVPQAPLAKVHWNTLEPTPAPLIAVTLLVGLAMVPLPLNKDHEPVAGAEAAVAVSVALGALLQASWSAPAFAPPSPLLLSTMVTSSVLIGFAQAPLLIVQRNTLTPTPNAVTALVGDAGVVIVPAPLTNIHEPVLSAVGMLPPNVVLLVGVHRF